jgi:peptidoglycan/LPS O-acetylase OafA/YrhL
VSGPLERPVHTTLAASAGPGTLAETPAGANAAKARYRPDIDGLRAIAVALVVLFHLTPGLLPTGFIGVDIFFVISGFVVTGSVMRRRPARGLDDVFMFWKRRVTRIYPALLVSVLATMAMVALFVPPFPSIVYNGILRTGLAAIVGAANLYLYRSRSNYFLSDQTHNPFLHMWSLGVEEQFYLFFSLTFLAAAAPIVALLRAHSSLALSRTRFVLVGLFTVASAALLLAARHSDPVGAYYLLQFRFWELGLGCLLALAGSFEWKLSYGAIPNWAGQLASAALLLAILWIAMSPTGPDPTPAIVLATLASAALIGLNSVESSIVKAALSVPPLRGMGVVSYSIYLWHWPIIVLFDITIGLRSFGAISCVLALTFAAAIGSYLFLERPLRRAQTRFWRLTVPILGVIAATILGLATMAQARPGFAFLGRPLAWATDWLPGPDFAYAGANKITEGACDLSNGAAVPVFAPANCMATLQRSAAKPPTILVVGDSFGFSDWAMLSRGFERGALQWTAFSHDGCNIGAPTDEDSASCRRYWTTMPQRIGGSLGKGDAVLVAVYWTLGDDASYDRALSKLDTVIVAAGGVGSTVIVQAPLPQFDRPAFLCTPEWFRSNYEGCSADRRSFESRRAGLMRALASLRSRYPNVLIWDPIDRLCGKAQCEEFSEGEPLFRDTDHLSYRGSLSLGDAFTGFLATARHQSASAAAPAA